MRIQRGQLIAGVDAMALRTAFRYWRDRNFVPEGLALQLKTDDARGLCRELEAEGYLALVKVDNDGDPWFALTPAGGALANATATKPYPRAVAARALAGLLQRAEEVNGSDEFLFWVDTVVLFGSFLDEARTEVGDVDVALSLSPRYAGHEFVTRSRRRGGPARASGGLGLLMAETDRATTEVLRYLKGRSPVLPFTRTDDDVLRTALTKVIYSRSSAALPLAG